MINLIIWLLCIIVTAIIVAKAMYFDEFWELIFGGIFGAILGFLIGIFVVLIIDTSVSSNAKKIELVDYTENIYSLQDNIGVEGKFYLGCGQVNDEMKFYYIIKENDNVKIKNIVNSNSVIIQENDSESPKIIRYKYEFTNEFVKKSFPMMVENKKIKIIIPKGSIKYNFNMDLK